MRTFEEIEEDVRHAMSINDPEALLHCAEELEAQGATEALAEAHNVRGRVSALRGNHSDALLHFNCALEMFTELGNNSGVANATNSIGNLHLITGGYSLALSHFHRALEVFTELSDRRGMASTIGNIGNVHVDAGNFPEALEHYHRAMELHAELGERRDVAYVTGNIGNLHFYTGNYPEALEHYHRALEVHREFGDVKEMAGITGNIGNIHINAGNYPLALEHFQRALEVFTDHGQRRGVAAATSNIGNVHVNAGNYPEALEHYRRALTMQTDLGNRDGVALNLGNIGTVHMYNGNNQLALESFNRALEIYSELGNRSGVSGMTSNIVSVLLQTERYAEAEALLLEMDSMQINEPGVVVGREQHRASIKEHHGDADGAKAALKAALEIADQHALAEVKASTHKQLRDIALRQNDLQAYVQHNDEYTRITEAVRGREVTQKLAVMEAEKKMAAERQEREKERALLYGALPEHIATRMLAGETIEDHFENAAVLFADIAGFTTHTASMHPSETIKLLEDFYKTFDAICEEHGATKVKTIGDSYLCFAHESGEGLSAEGLEAAQCVANVALKMLTSGHTWPDGSPLQLRIGIHSGPVSAGVIGTQRLQYDVWGDTVNVASRMESTGEPGRIQCSEAFVRSLTSFRDDATSRHPDGGEADEGPQANTEPWNYRTVERGTVEVKGKGSMTTYWLEEA